MPPQPTPTAVLAARGSWRANQRAGEPMPATVTNLEPPADLDGPSLDAWLSLAPALLNSGLLTVADAPTFARYCRVYVAWQQAMTAVEQTPDRQTVLTLAKLDEMLRKLEGAFGLTPSARTGVKVEMQDAPGKSRFFETRAS